MLCQLSRGQGCQGTFQVGQGRRSDCNEDYSVLLMEGDSGIMVAPLGAGRGDLPSREPTEPVRMKMTSYRRGKRGALSSIPSAGSASITILKQMHL